MAKELTIRQVAAMGGQAVLKKYGRRQLREWGKLGGRPKGSKNKKRPAG